MYFLTHILFFISVCFKIFDRDKDGQLNRSEITTMLQSMVEIRNQTLPPSERIRPEVDTLGTIHILRNIITFRGEGVHKKSIFDFFYYIQVYTSLLALVRFNGISSMDKTNLCPKMNSTQRILLMLFCQKLSKSDF